jgi:hypothetical protein
MITGIGKNVLKKNDYNPILGTAVLSNGLSVVGGTGIKRNLSSAKGSGILQ